MVQEVIPKHALPNEWAEYLCDEICRKDAPARLSWARMYCWFSHRFSPHTTPVQCFCRKEGNTGCPLVNARDRHYYWAFHKN